MIQPTPKLNTVVAGAANDALSGQTEVNDGYGGESLTNGTPPDQPTCDTLLNTPADDNKPRQGHGN